ncbi:MAG: hypothetical protein ABUL72_06525, partial [Armatimonadota bacterium]
EMIEGLDTSGEEAIEDTEAVVPFGDVEQEMLRSFEGASTKHQENKAEAQAEVVSEAPAANETATAVVETPVAEEATQEN